MKDLENRIAIVTGAGSGIGRAIAEAFAAAGAKTVLAARSRDKIESAAAAIREKGGTALAVPADVSSEPDVLALFKRTVEAYGRVDILVNNAGTNIPKRTEDLTLAEWNKVIGVNLTGAFLCAREAYRLMKVQKGGRIINIGSVSAKVSRANSVAYTTSKFALDGLTRSMALDGREFGIAVSVLHPGNTVSELWGNRMDQAEKEGIMPADELARVAVLMAALPLTINMLEGIVLPVSMPFIGRG